MEIERLIRATADEFGDDVVETLLQERRARLERAFGPIRRPQAAVGTIDSPLGRILVATAERRVVMIHYLDREADLVAPLARLRLEFDPIEDQRAVEGVGAEVRDYLAGDEAALRHRVDLTLAGNQFQKKTLGKLLTVPRGAAISYQALGAAVGAPRGARAVGNAMHANPVPIYVPCHRVICSDGRLGGYGGGISRKLRLLRSEGFAVDESADRIPDGTVWGYRGAKIFCRPDCQTAARADRSRILFFADPAKARQAGLRACKICRPE